MVAAEVDVAGMVPGQWIREPVTVLPVKFGRQLKRNVRIWNN
jgi:hypothetical protein